MFTITLDTNCLNARGRDQALKRLEELRNRGDIELRKTDALDTDLMTDTSSYSQTRREKSSTLAEDIGVCIIGYSRIGHTRFAGEDDGMVLDDLATILFQRALVALAANGEHQSVRDVMHVFTHIKHGRDYLVTRDGALLRRRDALLEKHGITVGSPEDCLEFIRDITPQGQEQCAH